MSDWPSLKSQIKRYYKDTAMSGGAQAVALTPPNGERWRILAMWTWHAGAGARDLNWRFTDPDGYSDIMAATSTNASTLRQLYTDCNFADALIVTPQAYLSVVGGAGFVAAEHLYVCAIIERLVGLDNV